VKPPTGAYAYSGEPTRNPLRFLLALWRVTRDLGRTEEAAIVEIGFARSRLGRRFARWERVLERLEADPRTAAVLRAQRRLGPIDVDALARLPEGTLGRVFAQHCRARGLDPNLVRIPGEGPVDRLLDRMYATHDLWHVTTGWGNDETGEVGLGGFYLAQLEAPFFLFLLAFIALNTVFVAPDTLRARMDALVAGYRAGRRAEPLFAADFEALFATPLVEVRRRLGLEGAEIVGDGIRSAA
jgi:ubiquinone biosynthesis protein Coq4